ncbi:MAG: DUF1559 domain-containing protein [Planctomycetes bacterium]|nr:DUF1559 domain-containing protein [Planctomycetota bacterium]
MEVLVAISVLSLLLSLIAPGILSARSAASKTECTNNLKNLATAAEILETTGETLTLETGTEASSWCRQLLPHLDLSSVERALTSSEASEVAAALTASPPVFRCAIDSAHDGTPAGLTYVANTGYIQNGYWEGPEDLNHTPDAYVAFSPAWSVSKTLATGAVFRPTSTGRAMKPVFGDGRSNTLLFSENIQAGQWTSRFTGEIAFGVDVTLDRNNGDTLELGTSVIVGKDGIETPSMINVGLDTRSTGEAPRPASFHPGGASAAFADGSVRFLNETMNQNVYFRLMTSSGVLHGQKLVSDSQF